MKKLILALILALTATSALAWTNGYRGPFVVNNYHGGYYGGYRGGCYGCGVGAAIVGGAIVGGIVAGALTPTYIAPAPVYVTPPPVIVQPAVPVAPYGYHYQNMLNPQCNCYQNVLVPN